MLGLSGRAMPVSGTKVASPLIRTNKRAQAGFFIWLDGQGDLSGIYCWYIF